MTGLEILFITSAILLLIIWGWFIFLGFNTSREWGLGLLFLFPLSPFLFAYRFERKTRKLFYYFLTSLVFFAGLNGWIYFATIDFFPRLGHKLAVLAPKFSSAEKPKGTLNLPPPTPIPEALPVAPKTPVEEIKIEPNPTPSRRYKTVDIDNAGSYIGKKVIITTEFVVHRGVLKSAGVGQIEIRKELGGGSTIMGIPKSKVQKFEVYL